MFQWHCVSYINSTQDTAAMNQYLTSDQQSHDRRDTDSYNAIPVAAHGNLGTNYDWQSYSLRWPGLSSEAALALSS
jgi:hypothetical protein